MIGNGENNTQDVTTHTQENKTKGIKRTMGDTLETSDIEDTTTDTGKRNRSSNTPEHHTSQTAQTDRQHQHNETADDKSEDETFSGFLDAPIQKTIEHTQEIHKLCDTHNNTKLEIKKASRDLVKITRALKIEYQKWLEQYDQKRKNTRENADSTQNKIAALELRVKELQKENETLRTKLETHTPNTATEHNTRTQALCNRCKHKIEEEVTEEQKSKQLATEIENAIGKTQTDEGLEEIINRTWPDSVYKKTIVVRKHITDPRHTRALLITEQSQKDDITMKHIATQFYTAAKAEHIRPGKVAIMSRCEDLEMSDDEEEGSSEATSDVPQYLVIGKMSASAEPAEIIKLTRKTLERAGQLTVGAPIGVYISEDKNFEKMRKTIEACARQLGLQIVIYTGDRKLAKVGSDKPTKHNTIRIKITEGKSYAETVAGWRGHLNPTHAGVKIRSMQQTKDGNVEIKVTEISKGGTDKFIDSIKGTGSEAHTKQNRHYITIALRDVDPLLRPQDIERGIRELLQVPLENMIRTQDSRCGAKGQWTNLVALPAYYARKLLEYNRIKLGGKTCRTEEWLQVPTCYNCKKVGHLAADCKDTEKTDMRCANCGSTNHTDKQCTAEKTHCYICEIQGHKANTTGCPTYRKILKDLLEKKWNKERQEKTNRLHSTAQPHTITNTQDIPADSTQTSEGAGWRTVGKNNRHAHK